MTRFVIIGAGPAGMRAAEILRSQAVDADILLIGDEPHLPYDRPPLSKAFITQKLAAPQLYLKPESFYTEQRIDLKLGSPAVRLDRATRLVELANGERVAYDKLLLATGCRCRELPASLASGPIHYLRSLQDADKIRDALRPGAEIVLIGGGFIGLELAASATKLGAKVTVLEAAPRLMSRAMPSLVSEFVRTLHERHGVAFELGARIQSVATTEAGRFVVKTERAAYACDMVIAGIGAEPNTDLAKTAGLAVEDGILVDEYGRTSDPDIFAAGDATRHHNPLLGRAIRVESWQVALNQGAAVARAMLGASVPYAEIPWLWTDQYDCNIQMLGFVDPGMEIVVRGDPSSGSFTIIGLDAASRIAAAITVNNGRDMAVLRRLVSAKASVTKDVLTDPARKLADLLKAGRS
jgi:anthranilate 1,2-dioxygenase ferredoxin reductase component